MPGTLTGRVALVTGAARRLGRSIALALAAEGAAVIVHYRGSREEAEGLCGEIAARGVRAWALEADLEDPRAVDGLLERARREAGASAGPGASVEPSILVNNASIFPPGALESLALAELERNIRVNAWAPFVLGRELARGATDGRIVNVLDSRISSTATDHAAYTLSKELLAVLTRMMALDFAPRATVNAVAPGPILPPPGGTQEQLEELGRRVPMRRPGRPAEVAEAVVFLARSPYVTGQVIFVDGGRHLAGGRQGDAGWT